MWACVVTSMRASRHPAFRKPSVPFFHYKLVGGVQSGLPDVNYKFLFMFLVLLYNNLRSIASTRCPNPNF